jgi:hypothetical protein
MVKIITHENGIIFDTTSLQGSGVAFAKKMFRPRHYPSVETVALWSDKIVGTSSNGNDFNISINGSNQSYPISHANGVPVTTLDELFDNFINTLV